MTHARAIAAVALVVTATFGCVPPAQLGAPNATRPSSDLITVLTWNVFLKQGNVPATLETILQADPQVVMLQEVTPTLDAGLREQLTNRKFHYYWCGSKPTADRTDHPPWYPAIASTFRFVTEPDCRVDENRVPNGFVTARIETPHGVVQIAAVHLAPANTNPLGWIPHARDRLRQIETLLDELNLNPGLPTIVAGDFNEPANGAAVQMLRRHGYADVSESISSLRGRVTWNRCWPTGFGPIASYVDFIFHDFSFDVVNARLLPHGPSDHTPVVAVLRPPASHHCGSP